MKIRAYEKADINTFRPCQFGSSSWYRASFRNLVFHPYTLERSIAQERAVMMEDSQNIREATS